MVISCILTWPFLDLCHQAGLSATRQKQLLEFLDGPKAKEERKKFASAKKFFCSTSAKSPSATSLDRAPSARCDLGLMPRLRKREDIEKRGDYQRDERPLLKTRCESVRRDQTCLCPSSCFSSAVLDDHEKASLAFHMAYGKPLPDAALVMKNAIETRRKEAQKKTRSVDRNERFSEREINQVL